MYTNLSRLISIGISGFNEITFIGYHDAILEGKVAKCMCRLTV